MNKNQLSAIKSAKLYNYLDQDKEATIGSSAALLASQASAALGFPVNEVNIGSMRKAMGLNPRSVKKEAPTKPDAIRILAREVIALKTSLGVTPIPSDLLGLVNGGGQ